MEIALNLRKILNLKKYNKISPEAKKYFRDSYNSKKKPLLFHLIPHILYKGKINIENCRKIEV